MKNPDVKGYIEMIEIGTLVAAEPLYRPFRAGEEVKDGMRVWYDHMEWTVSQSKRSDGWARLQAQHNSQSQCRQVIHALALLRIDGGE